LEVLSANAGCISGETVKKTGQSDLNLAQVAKLLPNFRKFSPKCKNFLKFRPRPELVPSPSKSFESAASS